MFALSVLSKKPVARDFKFANRFYRTLTKSQRELLIVYRSEVLEVVGVVDQFCH